MQEDALFFHEVLKLILDDNDLYDQLFEDLDGETNVQIEIQKQASQIDEFDKVFYTFYLVVPVTPVSYRGIPQQYNFSITQGGLHNQCQNPFEPEIKNGREVTLYSLPLFDDCLVGVNQNIPSENDRFSSSKSVFTRLTPSDFLKRNH